MPESEDGNPSLPDCGDAIDGTTFEQILEMDDDDGSREFSRELVYGFFDQASTTLSNMDEAADKHDLGALSSLGHYLKGSSATLGLTKVKDHCEKIQHLGAGKNEQGEPAHFDDKTALRKIKDTLPQLKSDNADAEKRLRNFYDKIAT